MEWWRKLGWCAASGAIHLIVLQPGSLLSEAKPSAGELEHAPSIELLMEKPPARSNAVQPKVQAATAPSMPTRRQPTRARPAAPGARGQPSTRAARRPPPPPRHANARPRTELADHRHGGAARASATLATASDQRATHAAVRIAARRGLRRQEYASLVRQRILRHRAYPYAARRRRLQGTICVRFSIGRQGSVLDLQTTCGAARGPLARAALRAVKDAAPFPPLPDALGSRHTLELPIVFRLQSP